MEKFAISPGDLLLMNTNLQKDIISVRALDQNFSMKVHGENELVSSILREKGSYSNKDLLILKEHLKPGSTFLDIGANIGWYSLFASSLVGAKGRVIAFEPDPENAGLLRENLKLNHIENTEVLEMALSESDGFLSLIKSADNFGDHYVTNEPSSAVQVQSKRLDSILSPGQFEKVGLIKMDTQGSEPGILRGMEPLLKEHRPHILIEFSPSHLYRIGNSPFEIFAFIEKFHYRPYRVHDHGLDGKVLTPVGIEELLNLTFQLKNVDYGVDLLLVPNFEKEIQAGDKAIEAHRYQDAEAIYKKLIRQNLNSAKAKSHLSYAVEAQGRWDESAALLREIIASTDVSDPEHFFAKYKLGWHLIREGFFKQGLEWLRLGRTSKPWGAYLLPLKSRRLEANYDLHGKKVLIVADVGFGDEIINVRFSAILKARGATIYYLSEKRSLANVLKRHGFAEAYYENLEEVPEHDYWVSSLDLPAALGLDLSDISPAPYLKPDTEFQKKWTEKINSISKSGKPKIGIRWQGDLNNDLRQNRNIPFLEIQRLTQEIDADFFSFQLRDAQADFVNAGIPLEHELTSWEDTLAALGQMDIVITSCTSIAHASAALGKETWVLLSKNPYYLWACDLKHSPWYKDVTLFRLKDSWSTVMNEVIRQIKGSRS
jgi:FkbM family methyltransferase